jgi:hypothetical protein
MSGERDVDDAVVSDWLTKLHSICEGYEPKDIFNMDETGLFYQQDSYFYIWGTCTLSKIQSWNTKENVTVT